MRGPLDQEDAAGRVEDEGADCEAAEVLVVVGEPLADGFVPGGEGGGEAEVEGWGDARWGCWGFGFWESRRRIRRGVDSHCDRFSKRENNSLGFLLLLCW